MLQRIGLRLQYLSDIHLEHRQQIPIIRPKTNYLALLGDIGYPNQLIYKEFLRYCSKNWDQVLLISGNHEYFHAKNEPGKRKIDYTINNLVSKYHNVHFLNNSSLMLDDYLFLGSTLWSDNPDHSQIRAQHLKSVAWLSENLAKNRNKEVVVLTHYLPSYQLIIPKYRDYPAKYRYATNLEHLIGPPIRAWLCGHSHCKYETEINGVYCGINAMGFTREKIEKN